MGAGAGAGSWLAFISFAMPFNGKNRTNTMLVEV